MAGSDLKRNQKEKTTASQDKRKQNKIPTGQNQDQVYVLHPHIPAISEFGECVNVFVSFFKL